MLIFTKNKLQSCWTCFWFSKEELSEELPLIFFFFKDNCGVRSMSGRIKTDLLECHTLNVKESVSLKWIDLINIPNTHRHFSYWYGSKCMTPTHGDGNTSFVSQGWSVMFWTTYSSWNSYSIFIPVGLFYSVSANDWLFGSILKYTIGFLAFLLFQTV